MTKPSHRNRKVTNTYGLQKTLRKLVLHFLNLGDSNEILVQRALRKGELEELILRKEIHWRQKDRVKWVKEGDCMSRPKTHSKGVTVNSHFKREGLQYNLTQTIIL